MTERTHWKRHDLVWLPDGEPGAVLCEADSYPGEVPIYWVAHRHSNGRLAQIEVRGDVLRQRDRAEGRRRW